MSFLSFHRFIFRLAQSRSFGSHLLSGRFEKIRYEVRPSLYKRLKYVRVYQFLKLWKLQYLLLDSTTVGSIKVIILV